MLQHTTGKLVFVMPYKSALDRSDIFKTAVCTHIDILDKKTFKETNMCSTAIFYCDRMAHPDNYCKKLDDNTDTLIDRLYGTCKLNIIPVGSKYTQEEEIDNVIKKTKEGKYYLNVSRANGSMGARWFSSGLVDVPVLDRNGEIEFVRKNTKVKNIVECPSKEFGENLKHLMLNGVVLRYGLWLLQKNQGISRRCFQYVPDINFEKINTDERLLLACGYREDEVERIIDYLKDFDYPKC